jgi:hypothetical protein
MNFYGIFHFLRYVEENCEIISHDSQSYLKQVPPNAATKRYGYTKALDILDTLLSCLLLVWRLQLKPCVYVNYVCIFVYNLLLIL